MKRTNEIPVPDPFSKEYEYFFPSASWEKSGITPLTAENNTNTDYSDGFFPYMTDIDVKIPEQ